MIRIIGGTAKNRKLKVPRDSTKPLTDRIKTSIFDLIREFIPGAKVLDLFAGSGAFGIEALSRGAESAVFIEKNIKAAEIINQNLHITNFTDRGDVIRMDAIKFLKHYEDKYDVIFADPPFPMDLEEKNRALRLAVLTLSPTGVLIIRYPVGENPPDEIGAYKKIYQKKYGLSSVNFYK